MLQQLRPGTRRLSTGPMLVIHLSVMVQPVPRRPSLRPKLRMTVAVPSMMKLVIILSMMMMMQPGCLMTRNGKTWGSSWLERWRRAQMHSPEFIANLFFDLLFFVEGKLLESNLSQANVMMRQVTEVCNQIRAMVRFCAQHNLEEDEIMAPASSASDSWLFQLDASAAIIAARQKFLESQKETGLGALLCSADWFPEHRNYLPNNKHLRRCVLSCAELEQHLRLKGLDAERKWSLGGWWPSLAKKKNWRRTTLSKAAASPAPRRFSIARWLSSRWQWSPIQLAFKDFASCLPTSWRLWKEKGIQGLSLQKYCVNKISLILRSILLYVKALHHHTSSAPCEVSLLMCALEVKEDFKNSKMTNARSGRWWQSLSWQHTWLTDVSWLSRAVVSVWSDVQ